MNIICVLPAINTINSKMCIRGKVLLMAYLYEVDYSEIRIAYNKLSRRL